MAAPTTVTANFRTLFTISDILHEVKMTTSTLKIQLSGNTKLVQLPCTKPASLDFTGVEMGSKIEFDLEDANGNIYGYSELTIPDSAFKNRETSINQQTHFYLNNSDKEFINAKLFIILLNTEISQRPKFKNALPRTPTKSHNSATKSPNKTSSTPQKKSESTPQKRLRTEERMSSNNSHQDIRDFDDSVRGNNDTFDQGDATNVQKTLHSQASIDSFLPSSLVQLSTPKGFSSDVHDEQSTFTSKIDQGSTSSLLGFKEMPRKILISSQPSLDKQRQSEPHIASFRDKHSSLSGLKKDERLSTQGDRDAFDGVNSSSMPTESDAHVDQNQFQTFCPRPSSNRANGGHGLNTPEKERQQDRDLEGMPSSAKRRPPSYSPISEKNVTARQSYSEIAFYKAQVEQLQTSLLSKESQLAIVNMLKQENEELKRALQKSEEARKTLQTVSSETTKELKHTNLELKSQIATVLAEKKDYLNRNTQLQTRVDELEKNASRAEVNLGVTESRNAELSVELKELKNAKDHMEKTKRALENFEKQRSEERTSYMNALATCQKGLEEAMAKVERLTKEKKEISEDFQKTQIALIQEKNISQGLRDELFLAQKSLQNAESYKLVVNSLENEKQELMKILFEKKKGQAELQTLLKNVKTDFAEKLKENEKREERYISQINTYKDNTKNYEVKIGSLTNEVSELRLKVSELLNEGSALEQLVCLNEDIEQQLEAANKKLTQVTSERDSLSEQLLTICQAQEAASNRLLKSEKSAREIRESLQERDEYIANLKKLVTELRESNNKYTPQRDDPIDMALARYLNSSSDIDKLKFLFFRESCGVYQFGTKRVFIKLEGDNIIIRVGGGYSTIEEFLDQHFQHEFEKFAKTAKSMSNKGARSSSSVERNRVQACY